MARRLDLRAGGSPAGCVCHGFPLVCTHPPVRGANGYSHGVLKHRLLLGPILIALLVLAIWLDQWLQESRAAPPGLVLLPVMLLAGIGAGVELVQVFRAESVVTSRGIVCGSIVLGMLVSSFTPGELPGVSGIAVACSAAAVVLLVSLVFHSRGHNVQGVIASASATLLSFVYVGLMGGFVLLLRKEFNAWALLAVLLITKSMDIGAYFTGRAIGRHKLIPWLSPGKTWEGLVGGVATSACVGGAAAAFSETAGIHFPVLWWHGLIFGALLGLIGQAGDLLASLLKRDAGVKDYSQRLPGFGGVLDVIDSPLLVAPAAYWLLTALSASEGVRGS